MQTSIRQFIFIVNLSRRKLWKETTQVRYRIWIFKKKSHVSSLWSARKIQKKTQARRSASSRPTLASPQRSRRQRSRHNLPWLIPKSNHRTQWGLPRKRTRHSLQLFRYRQRRIRSLQINHEATPGRNQRIQIGTPRTSIRYFRSPKHRMCRRWSLKKIIQTK